MNRKKDWMIIFMMSFVFWGMIYPQLTLTKSTYCCLTREGHYPEEDFYKILSAERGEIIVKSKIWEWITEQTEE